jgi:hypothetical protein
MNRVVLAGGRPVGMLPNLLGELAIYRFPPRAMTTSRPLLSNKLFWVGLLYFSEGYPSASSTRSFPVYFRQQGVELRQIGVLSLLGLAWTLKFLWAPAIDYWRHHRRFMAAVDVAWVAPCCTSRCRRLRPMVWLTIGVFTALSATNDHRHRRLHDRVSRQGRARARQRHHGSASIASECSRRASC